MAKPDRNNSAKRDPFETYAAMKAAGSPAPQSSHVKCRPSAKQGSASAVLKSIAVIALCIAGFVLPSRLNMGETGAALCLLGAVAIGAIILKR